MATNNPSTADRGAPVAFTAQPHSLAERLQYLVGDAKRILLAPEQHRAEEIAWARDMASAGQEFDEVGKCS